MEAEKVQEDSDNAISLEKIGNLNLDKENLKLQTKVFNHTFKDFKDEQGATFNYMTLESAEKGALLISIQSQLENIQAEQKIALSESSCTFSASTRLPFSSKLFCLVGIGAALE